MVKSKKSGVVDENLNQLDREIGIARGCTIAGLIALPTIYFSWFIYNGGRVSTNSGDWGTLGDFVGGLLNPAIAALALYWLTRSVRIQKEELRETREALDEAATAQGTQVKIAAIAALLQSANSKINAERQRVHEYQTELSTLNRMSVADAPERQKAKMNEIRVARQRIVDLEAEIEELETRLHSVLADA